ncbi:41 kD chloroplast nucleoid DNA binding protein (CND41) [Heracleum sosnowskyi]|uniref:41 kD chloroplast nucleoid DNA binding protein (CND41) n=1 Tax=Heracleum sosnowskyi TaxID=360622 RepID=A0AAD8HXE8_9APIA|nr:41 kD chloroplast nucleoid DNA binding protein (CND41) [Heracleum sosnowskyi]
MQKQRIGYVIKAVDRNLVAAETHDFHIITVSSMLPDSVCSSSSEGHELPSPSLKVVHRYGPCHKTDSPPSPSQILTHDEARVQSINSQITGFSSVENNFPSTELVTLPSKSGSSLGSGNYVVNIGLGSPRKDLSLVFDTGSSLTWTQCEPCAAICYKQHDPIFNPSESTGYANVSCNTAMCNQLKIRGCSGTTCLYGIKYGDKSSTIGYLAKDTLTLSPTEIITDFYFGCGQQNQGIFGQVAGIIGLGRNQFSIISQTSMKYGNIFSYCLPSTSSKPGYLTFGKSEISNAIQYIPLANSQEFYFIDITAIYVGGQKLPISPTVFSTYGSIIDSGTVITRLSLEAYTALKNSFRQQMSMYPMGQSTKTLDTCYDFSSYTAVKIPQISIEFAGNTKIDLDSTGILYYISLSQTCLAFATNTGITNLTILGNVQQKTMQVVYDVAGGKLGFGPNGCA